MDYEGKSPTGRAGRCTAPGMMIDLTVKVIRTKLTCWQQQPGLQAAAMATRPKAFTPLQWLRFTAVYRRVRAASFPSDSDQC